MNNVSFFKRNYSNEQKENLLRVLDTGFLTSGPVGVAVEEKLSSYFGCNDACLVNSWTNGFFVTLHALNLPKNAEIIVPAMTFVATANVPTLMGHEVKLADVDEETANVSWATIFPLVTDATKVVVVVHMYGLMANVAEIQKGLEAMGRSDIHIIEDCAHAFESTFENCRPGNFSTAAIFSFYATKNVSCGEGGAIISKDQTLIQKCKNLRLHGLSKSAHDRYRSKHYTHYDVEKPGYKANLPDLLSALLLSEIEGVGVKQKKRIRAYETYRRLVCEKTSAKVLPEYDRTIFTHAHHLFPIFVPKSRRDFVINHLNENGISIAVNFQSLTSLSAYNDQSAPVAEELGASQISLPFYPDIKQNDIEYVINTLAVAMPNAQ